MFWPLNPLYDDTPPGIGAAISPFDACEGRHGLGEYDKAR